MASPVSLSSINPLSGSKVGNLSTMGSILMVVAIVVVIFALIGIIIYYFYIKKQYWVIIKVYRKIGGTPMLVATHAAKEVPFGMAGDKLWKVGTGFLKIKTVKWLPVGRIQSGPREFLYYIRGDGEWINFQLADLDEISLKMDIKFSQEDLKLQRLATERLLEQRLMDKTFWEKWQNTIMSLIVFLVIAVCIVIIFYQWGKLIDKMTPLVESLGKSLNIVEKSCQLTYNATSGGYQGLIPTTPPV